MLRSGWTPEKFRRLYPDYTIQDVVLAVYPQSARKVDQISKDRKTPKQMAPPIDDWNFEPGMMMDDD